MTTEQNPSIGAIGHAYSDTVNHRTKGFFTQINLSVELARNNLHTDVLWGVRPRFGSRETYRILAGPFVAEADLRKLEVTIDERVLHCEAVIPVHNHASVAHIAYYSHNDAERCNDPSTTSQEETLLCAVIDKERHRERHDHSGYYVELSYPGHTTLNEEDCYDIAAIYRETFTSYLTELTAQAVRGMVESNVVTVVRKRDNGRIVAVAMAEVAEIKFENTPPLRIAEISEVSTHPLHQRRGLSHLACQALMNHLNTLNIHAVFSETRANHFAMMAVAYDCGLSPRGWLVQHCLIASNFSEVAQPTRFGDLTVFSL